MGSVGAESRITDCMVGAEGTVPEGAELVGVATTGTVVNVVVIGGAGFIGSHLVDRLLSHDHTVDVIDDLSTGSLANLADARAAGSGLKIHHLDATSGEADSLIGMRRPEVIHLLTTLPRSDQPPAAHARAFQVALAVLEAARRHGVAKVVVAVPATALHGHPTSRALPLKDVEIAQLVPRGVRGVVARALVDLLVSFRDLHAIEFTALAMATVYGPRQRPDGGVVGAFLHAAANARHPSSTATAARPVTCCTSTTRSMPWPEPASAAAACS